MTSASSSVRLEEWLEHEEFLRKVLRRLLASEADVDDALQQTWTKLLERPSDTPEEPRGWLTRVARNVALGGLRARRRRAEHEAQVIARARDDSPDESAARVEALQRVGAAILALEEPYRSVVLLRHEQELDMGAIARKLGRSEATVRSQLSRAHELLRRKLDRDFGGRERWAVLAAPLASPSLTWLVPGVVSAALVVVTVAWLARPRAPATGSGKPNELSVALVPAPPQAPRVDEASVAQEPGRESVDTGTAPAALLPSEPVAFELVLQGRLGDVGGNEHRVSAAGKLDYFRGLASAPLSLAPPFQRADEHAYVACTAIPDDHVVHVYRVDYAGRFEGMTRARNRYAIELGRTEFLLAPYAHADFSGTWQGDIVLAAAELERSRLVLGSSSAGEVRLYGESESRRAWEERSRAEGLARVTSPVPLPLREPLLRTPRALLQARAEHHGGNPIEIGIAGSTSIYVERVEPQPLDLTLPPEDRAPALVHFEGGHVPSGMAFVVTRATWWSQTFRAGSTVPLRLVVAGVTLAELAPPQAMPQDLDGARGRAGAAGRDGEPGGAGLSASSLAGPVTPVGEPVSGSWTGRLVVRPGQEEGTHLEVSYFTSGEALLFGELVALDSLPSEERGPKRAAPTTPVAKKPEDPPPPELARPRVVLQARAGAGGGNPNRIDLSGKKNAYVERVESQPLDLATPPLTRDPSLVYCEGGRVPTGQAFVITRATWSGTTKGDSNGPGGLKLVIAGKVIALAEEGEEPVYGAWNGRLVVRPGEESQTFLEIRNSSTADVLLTGYFEPLGR